MIEDPKDHTEQDRSLPDIEKLRRFSLGVGVALLIFVLAGGKFGHSIHTVLIPIEQFERPWIFTWALFLSSVYSVYRYWYYGIRMIPTRTRFRTFFRGDKSYYIYTGGFNDSCADEAAAISRRAPRGLRQQDFTVSAPLLDRFEDYKVIATKNLEHYFPGLTPDNIWIDHHEKGDRQQLHIWTHVCCTNIRTDIWCWLEDTELWLPVIVNGIAIATLFISWLWPEPPKLFQ